MERPGPEAFRRRFTALVVASGLSARELGAASDVGHSVISGWQRGDGLPQTADRLVVVVRVCIQAAGRRGTALTAAQRSEAEWRALLQSAKEVRDGRTPKAPRRLGAAKVSRGRWQMVGTEARGHFMRRSQGYRIGVPEADLFRGRTAAVTAVTSRLTAIKPSGSPIVITGAPGAGKSAVLARVVLGLEGGSDNRGVAVHARGMTFAAIVQALGRALGLRPVEDADGLLEVLRRDGPPLMIVVDALDEIATAVDRRRTAELLVSMARLVRLRAAVATRALSPSGRYDSGALLPALGIQSPESLNLVDLDTDRYFDEVGLRAFISAVLTQEGAESPVPSAGAWVSYRGDTRLTADLVHVIADRAGRNYLVAALASHELSVSDVVVDPAGPGFEPGQIPSTVGEAITKYLETLSESSRALKLALLTALAYARGDGIGDRRWVLFASALGYQVSQLDIDTLRQSPAAGYLLHITSKKAGRITRLFHQALVDELIKSRAHPPTDEHALLDTLRTAAADRWACSDDYTRTYSADHASAAHELSTLLQDEGFLSVADLDRLLALLPAQADARDAPVIAVLRSASHRARSLAQDRRIALFALAAAHLGLHDLSRRFGDVRPDAFRVAWAQSRGMAHQQLDLAGSEGDIAIGRLGKQDVIVAPGVGLLYVLDANGQILCEPSAGTDSSAASVAIGRLGNQDIIVSGGLWRDYEIRLWDSTGKPYGDPLIGHTNVVSFVAAGNFAGRDVIVSGSWDMTIRIWDSNGQPIGPPIECRSSVSTMRVIQAVR